MTAPCAIHATRTSWVVRRPGGPALIVGIDRAPLFLAWLGRVAR